MISAKELHTNWQSITHPLPKLDGTLKRIAQSLESEGKEFYILQESKGFVLWRPKSDCSQQVRVKEDVPVLIWDRMSGKEREDYLAGKTHRKQGWDK